MIIVLNLVERRGENIMSWGYGGSMKKQAQTKKAKKPKKKKKK